jgi:hypothetical protein
MIHFTRELSGNYLRITDCTTDNCCVLRCIRSSREKRVIRDTPLLGSWGSLSDAINEMIARVRLNNRAHFPWLQRKGCLFEGSLHHS